MAVVLALRIKDAAVFAGDVLHALPNQVAGARVQRQGPAQRAGRALAGMVIGRGAYAAKGKHRVAAGKGLRQRGGDALGVVTHVVRIGDLQAARAQ